MQLDTLDEIEKFKNDAQSLADGYLRSDEKDIMFINKFIEDFEAYLKQMVLLQQKAKLLKKKYEMNNLNQ